MGEIVIIVGAQTAERQGIRQGFPASSGSSNALLVVEALRRNIPHEHHGEGADINTSLHRCCHAEQVNFVCQAILTFKDNPLKPPLSVRTFLRIGLGGEFFAMETVGSDVKPCWIRLVRVVTAILFQPIGLFVNGF